MGAGVQGWMVCSQNSFSGAFAYLYIPLIFLSSECTFSCPDLLPSPIRLLLDGGRVLRLVDCRRHEARTMRRRARTTGLPTSSCLLPAPQSQGKSAVGILPPHPASRSSSATQAQLAAGSPDSDASCVTLAGRFDSADTRKMKIHDVKTCADPRGWTLAAWSTKHEFVQAHEFSALSKYLDGRTMQIRRLVSLVGYFESGRLAETLRAGSREAGLDHHQTDE